MADAGRRIIGLDYGSKTVGVSVSDPFLMTAQGVEIIRRERPTKLRQTLARIMEIVDEYDADTIVLGYPRKLDGTEGYRCEATKKFKELLEKRTVVPVILWDERLTTVQAENAMKDTGLNEHTDRKQYVDEAAAMLILQNYLDYLKNNNG